MNPITISPPSSISVASPGFMSETAYIIILSVGLIVILLIITFACYFCRRHVLVTTNLNQQRASPIAPTSGSDDQRPMAAGKQGLDEAVLSSYPKVMYSQVKLQYGNLTGSCCPICLADYKDEEMLLLLPDCAHFFHVKCGNQWLRMHPTCPICRKSPLSNSVPVSQLGHRFLIPDQDGSEGQNFESDMV